MFAIILLSLDGGRILPLEELTARAEVCGLAVVESAACRLDDRNGMIYTDHVLSFLEVWKGDPRSPFILTKPGGTIGTRSAAIAGEEYTLAPGERIVVFARRSPLGPHVVVGLRQGLYRKGQAGDLYIRASGTEPALPLRDLKASVAKALGLPVSTQPPAATTTPEAEPARQPLNEARPPMTWLPALGVGLLLAAGLTLLWRRRRT